ncbi:hypothetical protein ACJX0J_035590 [Zea mays]
MMILVDGAGGEWPVIGHAPWNGCNLADFVMPFFLFIVGMAVPLALKRIPDRGRAVRRVVVRTLKLLFWGILLQGGYSHAPDELAYGVDMRHVRWGGILQRIALAYLVVAVLEMVTKDGAKVHQDQPPGSSGRFSRVFRMYLSQWIVACCILVVYLSLAYGVYVPDWEFRVRNADSPDYGKVLTVRCGTRGALDPPCNAVGYIDRRVLGINHMYQKPAWRRHRACTDDSPHEGPFREDAPAWCVAPFEPEGILSIASIPKKSMLRMSQEQAAGLHLHVTSKKRYNYLIKICLIKEKPRGKKQTLLRHFRVFDTGPRLLEKFGYKNKLDNMKKEYTWFMDSKNNIMFRKQGPKHLDDLHMFGTSASCPGDISSDDSSDDKMMKPHAHVEDFELFIYINVLVQSEILAQRRSLAIFIFGFWSLEAEVAFSTRTQKHIIIYLVQQSFTEIVMLK